MNKKYWLRLSLGLFSLSALVLPWQTKFIISPAASNYWEIAIYAGTILVWLSLLTLLPAGVITSKRFFALPVLWRWAAGGLILAGALSSIFSSDPIISFYFLALILTGLAFFFFVDVLGREWKNRLAVFFLVSLAIQAGIGLYQFVTQTSFASSILGIAYHSASELGTAVIETADGRWLRAYGASGHPNAFGGLMALGAIGSLILLFQVKRRWERWSLIALYLLFISATLVSFSRAALLALFVGLAIFVIENIKRLRTYSRASVILFALSIIVAGTIFTLYRPLFIARSQIGNRLEMISIDDRREFNRRGWHNFLQYPLSGTGLAASTITDRFRAEGAGKLLPAWSFQPAHNYWLLAATEGGIFFPICLAIFWAFAYQKSRQRRLVSIMAVLFFLTLFDHWLFSLPLAATWVFFLFALMW